MAGEAPPAPDHATSILTEAAERLSDQGKQVSGSEETTQDAGFANLEFRFGATSQAADQARVGQDDRAGQSLHVRRSVGNAGGQSEQAREIETGASFDRKPHRVIERIAERGGLPIEHPGTIGAEDEVVRMQVPMDQRLAERPSEGRDGFESRDEILEDLPMKGVDVRVMPAHRFGTSVESASPASMG